MPLSPHFSPGELEVLPLERAETIPATWYTSEEIHRFELEAVFGRHWQLLTSLDQIAAVGAQVPTSIANEPIVCTHDKSGAQHAFYNVCRHRGGPLVTEAECGSMLQCKYHGWTYQLDGMLRGVPDFDRVELFDKKDFGLVEIEARAFENLLFGSVGGDLPFESLIEGIAERTAQNPLSRKRFYSRDTYRVKCNWKIFVDNYLEGYHVPIVHPELVKIYEFTKYLTETFDWYSLQSSPLDPEESNPYNKQGGEALYYFIYPNLMLNILPGRLQTNLVRPISATECEVIFDYYYDDLGTPQAEAFALEDIRFSHAVQLEDIEICELVQRGVQSRSYHTGRFSVKRENAVHHFQSLLRNDYREALGGSQPASSTHP